VSPRQIKRDIEYLRWRLDAPVVYDPAGHRYRYDKPFAALRFTDERRVLFSALVQGWASSPAYRGLVAPDLLESLRATVARDYRPVADRIRWEAPTVEPVELELFSGLCRGLRDRKVVELEYRSLAGETTVRRVEVQRLIQYGGVWYLAAWDHLRSGLRTFHLGRITGWRVTSDDAVQARQPGWEERVDRWIGAGSGIFLGGETVEAVVRLRDQARRLAEAQRWHPDQADRPGADAEGAYLERRLPVADFRELVGRLLALGGGAEAREPEEFRRRWSDEIASLARRAGY